MTPQLLDICQLKAIFACRFAIGPLSVAVARREEPIELRYAQNITPLLDVVRTCFACRASRGGSGASCHYGQSAVALAAGLSGGL